MTELTDEEAKALLAECDNPDCLTCEYARALLDARAELAASPEVAKLVAEAEARGMERAANVDWQRGRDVIDPAPDFLSDWQRGLVAGQQMMRAAILAEAEKITSSDAGGAHGCAVQTSQPGEVPASASPAPLTLRAGKCYRDGHGEVKGPLHAIWWENGEEMLTDSYVVWHPDGTLAGGTREDKRSLVAEVGDSNA